MWENTVEPSRPHVTVQCTSITCWITQATYVHIRVLTIRNTYSSPTVTMVAWPRLNVTLCAHGLSCHSYFYSQFSPIFTDSEEKITGTLMFVPCIIRRSRNNQLNAQLCTTALFIYYPMLSHSPFYVSTTLDTCFISYMLYHILTRCTSCCYYVILTLVRPGVISSFNLFYSTKGALYTDSYLLYILDKPPYRFVFSRNSDGSRSSLKIEDYCRNM
jgi:hypothetical protein